MGMEHAFMNRVLMGPSVQNVSVSQDSPMMVLIFVANAKTQCFNTLTAGNQEGMS
jgi:hypothetical protein